jgi:hypothetical protein
MRLSFLMVIIAFFTSLPARAQDAERRQQVELAAGAPTRTFSDAIGGFEAVSYAMHLRSGQTLDISLATNNLSNCFDVYTSGAEKPFFVGGDSGSSHRFRATASGEYIIKVYLLRLAARDNQSAHYSLGLKITD